MTTTDRISSANPHRGIEQQSAGRIDGHLCPDPPGFGSEDSGRPQPFAVTYSSLSDTAETLRHEIPFSAFSLHDDVPRNRVFTTFAARVAAVPNDTPAAAISLFSRHMFRISENGASLGLASAHSLRKHSENIIHRELQSLAERSHPGIVSWKCRLVLGPMGAEFAAEPVSRFRDSLPQLAVITFHGTRPEPHLKSTWTSVSRAAREAADRAGAAEALLINNDGQLTEGAWSNLLWEDRHQRLWSPAAPHLPGTALSAIADYCFAMRRPILFRPVTLAHLLSESTAILLTQSTSGVSLVRSIDGNPVSPSPDSHRLVQELQSVLDRETASFRIGVG